MVEADKMKKDFELDTPEKFTYSSWHKWDKSVYKYLSTKFNLWIVPLRYVISRDEVPDTVNFTDGIYDSNKEHYRMILSPLTGVVYKWYNIEVHNFLKFPTQGTEA